MNPHAKHSISIVECAKNLWSNRSLVVQMVRRDVVGRYKGSFLGLGWSFFNPLLMLAVYTFVFSVVFNARWGVDSGESPESKLMFALILFIGLIVHSLFSEILNNAPRLVVNNPNYVKKVVFPLEILPVVSAGSALFHAVVSLCAWFIAYTLFVGLPSLLVFLLPIVLLPLIVLSVGLSWLLASIGVFLRDVGQTVSIITTIMLFLAPVFFPISSLPERFHPLILANPLTFIIEQARQIMIWDQLPDFIGLAVYLGVSSLVFWLGFAWFQITRKGFPDVL